MHNGGMMVHLVEFLPHRARPGFDPDFREISVFLLYVLPAIVCVSSLRAIILPHPNNVRVCRSIGLCNIAPNLQGVHVKVGEYGTNVKG